MENLIFQMLDLVILKFFQLLQNYGFIHIVLIGKTLFHFRKKKDM